MSKSNFYQNNLRWLYVIEFFSSLYFMIPVWVSMELTYISLSQLTIIEIIIFGSQLVLELPTGAFADLLGKRITVFLGNVITAISMVMFALATSFEGFVLSAIFIGLGAALTSGAKEALLYDTLKQADKEDTFDRVSSKQNVVFQGGMAAATLIGGLLWTVDYKLPALLSGLAVLVAAGVTLLVIEPDIDSEVFTLKNYIQQTKQGFKEVFRTKYSTLLSFFYATIGALTFSASTVFSKVVFVELLYSESQMGVYFSVVRIFNSLLLYLMISRTKILTLKRTMWLFAFATPLVFLPGTLFTKILVVPFVLGMMWLSSACWVLLGKYTNKVFTSKNRATAISALSMMVGIFYIGIMLVSGPIMEYYQSVLPLFTFLGVLALVIVLPLGIRVASHSPSQE